MKRACFEDGPRFSWARHTGTGWADGVFLHHGGPKDSFDTLRDTPLGVSLLIFCVWTLEPFSVQRNAAICFCVDGSGGFAGMVLYTAGFTAVRYAAICVKRVVSSSRALTSWLTCSFSIVVCVAMA